LALYVRKEEEEEEVILPRMDKLVPRYMEVWGMVTSDAEQVSSGGSFEHGNEP
jgi:hypothetical protein